VVTRSSDSTPGHRGIPNEELLLLVSRIHPDERERGVCHLQKVFNNEKGMIKQGNMAQMN